jgi:protein-disulfide isomerase-like protein with CxxC motif
VTRASLREYAAVQRVRYQQATRGEKHQFLDEIVAVTGLHRKPAIRLLGRAP